MSISNYSPAFGLQPKRRMGNFSQRSRAVPDASHCVDLVSLLRAASTGPLGISPPRLSVVNFRQPLTCISVFQVEGATKRGTSHLI
jgi:hypothetical protein